MDAFKNAFEKLKQLKTKVEQDNEQTNVDLANAMTKWGVPAEDAQSSVKMTSDFINSGGLAGTVGKVGQGATKVFRDPTALKSLGAVERKAALEKLMGIIKEGKVSGFKKSGIIK